MEITPPKAQDAPQDCLVGWRKGRDSNSSGHSPYLVLDVLRVGQPTAKALQSDF